MEGAAGEQRDDQSNHSRSESSFVIKIPSYQEVIESSRSEKAPSLFNPSPSFSQAFNFIKNSEFYEPPPPPPSPPAPASPPPQNADSSRIGQSEVLGSSYSAVASTSKGQNGPSRNAILVSHRQEDVVKPLLEVTKTALLHDCTLLCGWSLEECARYLETIKVYENKPADIIQGQMDTDYLSRLNHALTTVRRVNKTDVVTLGSTFGSLSHIMDASMEDLARCPGIGECKLIVKKKSSWKFMNMASAFPLNILIAGLDPMEYQVKRLYDTFHEPFKRVSSNRTSGPEAVQPITVGERKEDENKVEDASKRKKEDPETTVKSALSAAFAKYKERVGEKNIKSQQGKGEEENRHFSEEAAS
ncbi:hypothetical protein RJ640_028543 [Escallonia rubra]|uniref:ERCC1-like central domain-containing protein n=1 Tax=Escallonia rubra TaxID=112253 RepID=A0AA88R7E7_9ASTE|nr:hypothetical protein RJ640_028543 [Escallonia rubra]